MGNIDWGPVATVAVALLAYVQFRSSRKSSKAENDRLAEARDREQDRGDRATELTEIRELNDRLRIALEDADKAVEKTEAALSSARTAATSAAEAAKLAEEQYGDLKRDYDAIVERLEQIERDLSASKDENAVLRNLIEVAVEHIVLLEQAIGRDGEIPARPEVLTRYLEDQRRTRRNETHAEHEERGNL